MYREIEFRGRRVDNGDWVYGCLIIAENRYFIIPSYASDFYGFEVISETVAQYTGLKDKNGNKIYRGDKVLLIDEYSADMFSVEFDSLKYIAVFEDGEILDLDEYSGHECDLEVVAVQ